MQANATPKVVLPLEEWLIRAVLILLGSASIILYIGQYTDLDLILADYYFDAAKGVFLGWLPDHRHDAGRPAISLRPA